jgi:hypothetical protein
MVTSSKKGPTKRVGRYSGGKGGRWNTVTLLEVLNAENFMSFILEVSHQL